MNRVLVPEKLEEHLKTGIVRKRLVLLAGRFPAYQKKGNP